MGNKEQRLKELKEKKESLKYILEANFENIEDYNNFKKNNKNLFDELKKVNDEIQNLGWELMSEKEKQEYLDYQQKIKEKYSDE